jgi:F-type H+-transporting ATPase subunit c
MNKLRMASFTIIAFAMTGMTALAQAPVAGDNDFTVNKYRAIAAGFGFALAVAAGAVGQSRIAAAAVEGAARNPGAAGRIQTMMILGLALIESLVLFALLVTFAKL